MKGPKEKELKDIDAEKKKKKFSEMVNLYQEKGLKSLSEMLVKEEPDNEQFTKELEDAKAKSEGKKRNTEIAKGAVQAVKQEGLDINDINGVQMSTIEERHMTDDEMEKREKIVKSMKKGMAGFKDRYGDRAKNVMYATANKQAMKD
jgi:phage gp36-like protein